MRETTLHDLSKAIAAADKIRAITKDLKAGAFDWEEWKAYKDEGRR